MRGIVAGAQCLRGERMSSSILDGWSSARPCLVGVLIRAGIGGQKGLARRSFLEHRLSPIGCGRVVRLAESVFWGCLMFHLAWLLFFAHRTSAGAIAGCLFQGNKREMSVAPPSADTLCHRSASGRCRASTSEYRYDKCSGIFRGGDSQGVIWRCGGGRFSVSFSGSCAVCFAVSALVGRFVVALASGLRRHVREP